jgi:hypothetical protein
LPCDSEESGRLDAGADDETSKHDTTKTWFKPRCSLETIARQVFLVHTQHLLQGKGRSTCGFDPSMSGAEWWVQVRSQGGEDGKGEHHSVLADRSKDGPNEEEQEDEEEDELAQESILFHWDKVRAAVFP